MASWKHDILKFTLNTLSLPMYWRLPPINHLRSLLETSTVLSTLPWGIDLHKVDFDLFTSEWLRPKDADPTKALLFLHGGGYVIGSPHTHRALAGKIAKGAGICCLLIDYRKAPEHPFPAALEDALEAYQYLLNSGIRAQNIVITGDSAGGGLAVALQVRLKQLQLPLPGCSVLLSPYLDLTVNSKSIKYNAKNDRFLDVFEMRRWAELYSGRYPQEHPLISPLFADLQGLPPVLVQASRSEVLYSDAQRFVKKARAAGVKVTFQQWTGLIHWWHMFGTMPESRQALDKIAHYLQKQLKSGKARRSTHRHRPPKGTSAIR
jgi:acetyl esterase/lipase